ncbi:Retrovirus-related Pol polyprotein from transposon RE1 [Vitis vinifera]|uniref:Retrovirus-related Pol polyprotein from transposon RE1 n=1 Tax=Vitis vinifera TaxID=29760 RepID=A0A438K2A6_VITVI|nr:Retrovirus-related Pol polyprotein from transposon RE1 [Vitis vinifera]
MIVLCDNKATISIAKNPVQHDRTKHVEIDRHFIKEKLEGGTIRLMYIPSSRQTADILTKTLPKATYENMKSNVSWTPSFLLKRYVLTGIPDGPHEPFIADSVDFVVSQVEP